MSKPSNMMGIGTIGKYYGNLQVARDDEGRFFWGIEDHDGCEWEQIPKSLYDELVKFEESQRPTADKALIEAAPELLEALQAAVQELYDHAGEEPGSGRYAHLDRIIAKATGATP